MSILTIQKRMRELGRIRIGQKGPKGEPKKLTTFRFTSHDKRSVEMAASIYGGNVVACDAKASPDLKGQWEVVSDASEIPFYPSPVAPSQWMELWSGGGCQRRCDGCTETLSGESCMCDPECPDCKPTTRLSVILPDLPDIGVWRIESKGWNAAQEIGQTYEWLRSMIGNGRVVEARLAVEERTGKQDGKTTRFMVPCIRIPQTPRELMAGVGVSQLEPGKTASLPGAQKELPASPKHETPDHILKDPNPRGGCFAILKELSLPEHEGKAKELYYQVFGKVLRQPVTSLSALTDGQWRTLWVWLLKVKDGQSTMPKDFAAWIEGKHSLQQFDPMSEDEPKTVEPTDPFADTQPSLMEDA